jgi:hypothetical protein
MPDKMDIDYILAQRELHDALNELRKMQGQPPLPFESEGESGLEYCSFCGKKKNEVKALIAGPNVYICDECVITAHKLLGET